MAILDLIFGFLLLFVGRSLFWLCVGIIGFLVGVQCSESLGFTNEWTAVVSAFALGSVGIVLALSFEWIMVVFGVGFLGGGYLLMNMLPLTAPEGPYAWPVFVVGGVVGMCLMVIAFDWALIMISSLLGATLIINAFHLSNDVREILFIISMGTGVLVQYSALRGTTTQRRHIRRRHAY